MKNIVLLEKKFSRELNFSGFAKFRKIKFPRKFLNLTEREILHTSVKLNFEEFY